LQNRSSYGLIVHSWDLGATKNGGDRTVCANTLDKKAAGEILTTVRDRGSPTQ
jgi:hypothetical protein